MDHDAARDWIESALERHAEREPYLPEDQQAALREICHVR